MSLRRDVHAAFDEIAPPLGGMPERVMQTVLYDKQRRKKGMLTFRARVPLPLVAALVAVAVVAAALIGSQLIQAWNAAHNSSPAGQVHLTALEQLEARPLQLPASATCVPPPDTSEASWGAGPLYGYAGLGTSTTRGHYTYAVLYTDRTISGPILVRMRDLVSGVPLVFVGSYSAGPAVGSDTVDGTKMTQRAELVLDEAHTTPGGMRGGWPVDHHRFVWDVLVGAPAKSGATFVQIDAAGFTETFTGC